MLKKAYRINKNWEFQNIYRKGRGFSSQFFSINLMPSKYGFNRFGIVVSKKVARKAVDRNRLKRQVRDMANEVSKKSNTRFDIIISTKPQALDTDFTKLKTELESLFQKANIIK